jgi:hypothetical protein
MPDHDFPEDTFAMATQKKPVRPKWQRSRPVVLMPEELESGITRFFPHNAVGKFLFGAILAAFMSLTMIATASAAASDGPSFSPPTAAAVAEITVNAASVEDGVTLILDRRPLPSTRRAPRRRGGRTKADVEREQRELLENTQREVDAIAAEYHKRLPRAKAKRIGLIYARYSTRFQSSVAAQVRAMYEIAVREGTFVPRGLVFFDLAVRGYRDNRPGLNGLRAALTGKEGNSLLVAPSASSRKRSSNGECGATSSSRTSTRAPTRTGGCT